MDADGCGEHQGVQVSLAPPRWPTRGQISSLCTPGVKDLDEKRKKVKIFRFCQFNYLSLLPMYIMYIHRQEPTEGSTHVTLLLSTCCGPSVGNSVHGWSNAVFSHMCLLQDLHCSFLPNDVVLCWLGERESYLFAGKTCKYQMDDQKIRICSSRLVSLMWIKALTGDVRRLNPSCWKPDLLCENCVLVTTCSDTSPFLSRFCVHSSRLTKCSRMHGGTILKGDVLRQNRTRAEEPWRRQKYGKRGEKNNVVSGTRFLFALFASFTL